MPSRHQVHLYRGGLEECSRSLRGDELIYSGLRPSDYHAGNSVVLAVYPHLLARAVAGLGRPVRFDYVITLNDIEPSGYDLRTLRPEGPSLAFTSPVERVVARVREDLRPLTEEFPEVRVRFVRTSSMVGTDVFRRTVEILTRGKGDYIARFLQEKYIAGRDVEGMDFVGQVCGNCQATMRMSFEPTAPLACEVCGATAAADGGRHYWMYYIPLIALKLCVIQPDVALLGSDYAAPHRGLLAGMRHANSLEAILDFYDLLPGGRRLSLILPPVLLGSDGQKMSKSLGNIGEVAYNHVLDACAGSQGGEISL